MCRTTKLSDQYEQLYKTAKQLTIVLDNPPKEGAKNRIIEAYSFKCQHCYQAMRTHVEKIDAILGDLP